MFLHRRAALVFLLLVLPLAGCSSGKVKKREKYLQAMAQSQDKYKKMSMGQEIDGERATDAETWLDFTRTDNVTNVTTRKQTIEYMHTLYQAGAEKVYCISVVRQLAFRANMCSALLIQMPKDAQRRQSVLSAINKIEKEFWGDVALKVKPQDHDFVVLDFDPFDTGP
jgi:hypothetical protein